MLVLLDDGIRSNVPLHGMLMLGLGLLSECFGLLLCQYKSMLLIPAMQSCVTGKPERHI